MEPLSLDKRKISKFDLITGVGGSFLVHFVVFAGAFIAVWTMPHKPVKPPFCSVNLVSLKDIGTGSTEPKGVPSGSEEIKVHDAPKSYARVAEKTGPALPVKRLHLDETSKTHEVPIKRIEPSAAPNLAELPRNQASVNIDKLIPKPKVVPQHSASSAATGTHEAAASAPAQPAAARTGRGTASAESAPRGTPTGSANAGARGDTHGSTAGSPDGSSAMNALAGMYGEKVKDAIQRHWRLSNEQGSAGTMAIVQVQIRKNGEIVSVHINKASGNNAFDEAAVRAVQKAAPLPAVPEAMVQSNVITLVLKFKPGSVS